MSDEFLTITQLAAHLLVQERVIRRYVKAGTIPYRKVGKSIRFRWRDIEAWWDALSKQPATFRQTPAGTTGIPRYLLTPPSVTFPC